MGGDSVGGQVKALPLIDPGVNFGSAASGPWCGPQAADSHRCLEESEFSSLLPNFVSSNKAKQSGI